MIEKRSEAPRQVLGFNLTQNIQNKTVLEICLPTVLATVAFWFFDVCSEPKFTKLCKRM